jgi:hypothetical protein
MPLNPGTDIDSSLFEHLTSTDVAPETTVIVMMPPVQVVV